MLDFTQHGVGGELSDHLLTPTLQMMVGWGGVESKQINKSSWDGSIRQISEGLEIIHQEPSS